LLIDETISNLRTALAALRQEDARLDAHLNGNTPEVNIAPGEKAWAPPVLGSPQWFLDEVREHYGQTGTDYEVDELCGLKIIQREELSEPIIVRADGSWFRVVPAWARKAAAELQAEEFARRVTGAAAPLDVKPAG
jgi:hypothetical protein